MSGLNAVLSKIRTAAPITALGRRFQSVLPDRLKVRPVEDPRPFMIDETAQQNHVKNHIVPFNVSLTLQPVNPLYPGFFIYSDVIAQYQSVMTQQVTGMEYSCISSPAQVNDLTFVVLRTPVILTAAQLFTTTGDQTMLYHRRFRSNPDIHDRKQFQPGFNATPAGWYTVIGEIFQLMAVAIMVGPGAVYLSGEISYDYLQTFRQTVNR